MKLHLPNSLRKAVLRAICAVSAVVSSFSGAYAAMITPDGSTATSVMNSGSVYNVYTGTVHGNIGFNSFSAFDVYTGTTVNLHLPDHTGKLINVVRDKATNIDGILNSYRNGSIGGDVYLLNPNGIFVGKNGVINVGSISMSTPTATFVEELIRRDGRISDTATQAVLDGDMPINAKGVISVKGKVNAKENIGIYAGKAEVTGELHTKVKFDDMVNTKGTAHLDGKGMSVSNGKISFGKKPRGAKAARPRRDSKARKADIAVFAEEVYLAGAELDGPSVYIDPDKAEMSNMAISGDYMLEARVIVLSGVRNDAEKKLTSFTLHAANELNDGTFDGNVSITLSDSNLTAGIMDIKASATSAGADAVVVLKNSRLTSNGNLLVSSVAGPVAGNAALTVTDSTLTAVLADAAKSAREGAAPQSVLQLQATAENGGASVTLGSRSVADGAGDVVLQALAGHGPAAVLAAKGSKAQGNSVNVSALGLEGDATVTANGTMTGKEGVSLAAETGWQESNGAKTAEDMVVTPRGGGVAKLEVNGKLSTEGNMTLAAHNVGAVGSATLLVGEQAVLTANGTVTRAVGKLELPRSKEETLQDGDSEDVKLAKNKAYMDRYAAYLKTLPQATVSESQIQLSAGSSAGGAAVTLAEGSSLNAGLAVRVVNTAATEASVQVAGQVKAGEIAVKAEGAKAVLSLPATGVLTAGAHPVLESVSSAEGSGCSLVEKSGSIELSAKSAPVPDAPQEPVPAKKDGVILEVAGSLISRRERGAAGEGGMISLSSDGTLSVQDAAVLEASSAVGQGGTILLSSPEYALAAPLSYSVSGTAGSGAVTVLNCTNLTAENLNNADSLADDFLKELTHSSTAPEMWHVQFSGASLDGTVVLNKDWDVNLSHLEIANGTHIIGNGHSMTFSSNFGETVCSVSPTYTVGDNVRIDGVKDFTANMSQISLANLAVGAPLTLSSGFTFGKNFTLNASGNVSISCNAYGGTYITFKPGANITAGGKVSIAAETANGWGFNLFSKNSPMDMEKFVRKFSEEGERPWLDTITAADVIKISPGRIFIGLYNWLKGKPKQSEYAAVPQFGFRISKASVTFEDAPGVTASITGSNVSISADSTAESGGRTKMQNGYAGISVFFLSNNSKVDLGSQLTITATGSASSKTGNISITSSADTTSSPALLYGCDKAGTTSLAFMLNVISDSSTVNIGKGTTLHAAENVNVSNGCTVEQCPFTSSGVSDASLQRMEVPNNMLSFGANVLLSDTKTQIDGALIADRGNISVKNTDDINSTLTMGSTLSFTVTEEEEEKEPEKYPDSFLGFLRTVLADNISFDLAGLYNYKLVENPDERHKHDIEKDGIANMFTSASKLAEQVRNILGGRDEPDAVDRAVAFSLATTVVKENNQLVFNGTATAKNGSVTLNAESSMEVAAGAETSVLGVPARSVYAISLSAPVVCSTVSADIGSSAKVTAAKNIDISSSTELPMSFDFFEWRSWQDAFQKDDKCAADFIAALRKSAKFLADYYDSGNFGLLDTLTSSHAYTVVEKTGVSGEDSKSFGGSMTLDYRNLRTLTTIADGAVLTAGERMELTSSAEGLHIAAAGQIPFYLTMGSRKYVSTEQASSGYGASFVLGRESMDTVTYVGKANLTAGSLSVNGTADVFALELSAAGTFGASKDGAQGAINLISEDKMTVAEISNGAAITLTGAGEQKESDVSAEDKSALWNVSGLEADGSRTAVGVGVAITLDDAYTAALLGNDTELPESFRKRWTDLADKRNMPFAGSGTLALNLPTEGAVTFSVESVQHGTDVTLGIAAAVQTASADTTAKAAGAANLGFIVADVRAEARQSGVKSTKENGDAEVETHAENNMKMVSIAGDVTVNRGGKNIVTGAGALSVNDTLMNTVAEVKNSEYAEIGSFTVKADNTAALVAMDVAAAVGAATANVAAGSAWNSATGITKAYLTGGSVEAGEVEIAGKTDLLATAVTLGAAINIDVSKGVVPADAEQGLQNMAFALVEEGQSEADPEKHQGDIIVGGGINDSDSDSDSELLALADASPDNMLRAGGGASFAIGASITRNYLSLNTDSVLEGCEVTADESLAVTAEDTSVITSVSVGAAVQKSGAENAGLSVAAGGVFSFAPVNSTTHAAIRQSKGESELLDITAGSLTLTATDDHRERLWAFGGGYGDSLGIGAVVAWGSYAGASTLVDMDSVNLSIGKAGTLSPNKGGDVTILASSTMENTFVAVGGSGSSAAAFSGTVNYQNFNNRVETALKNSTLTVGYTNGAVSIGSKSVRQFTDVLGAVALDLFTPSSGIKSPVSGALGAALSFIYLGGNGEKDYCTTYTTVSGSTLNNSGKTSVFADSTVTGTLAEVSSAVAVSDEVAISLNGSYSWITDCSDTRAVLNNTTVNGRASAADKQAKIEVKAKSNKHLTTGVGSLGVAISPGVSGAIGVSAHFLKDSAVTMASMRNGSVAQARDFRLLADSEAHLNGLLIGGGGSGTLSASGAAFVADIKHDVDAMANGSYFNLTGGLDIKAANKSRIGDGKTRFTIANGDVGLFGAAIGAAVSLIDVKDEVNATAHNVSVTSSTADITATEDAFADTVTVNFAGALYGSGTVDVGNPCLQGQAVAAVTSDRSSITLGGDVRTIGISTSGNLNVTADNTQHLRSHVWTFSVGIYGGLTVNVNRMNFAGCSNAYIEGNMALTIGGDMNVLANTKRTAGYTTVTVAAAGYGTFTYDENTFRVSEKTDIVAKDYEKQNKDAMAKATSKLDDMTSSANSMLSRAQIQPLPDMPLLNGGPAAELRLFERRDGVQATQPLTFAKVDLKGNTANVTGDATVKATETVETTPTMVGVNGGAVTVGAHIITTQLESDVKAEVIGSTLKGKKNIYVGASYTADDDFDAVIVPLGIVSGSGCSYKWDNRSAVDTEITSSTLEAAADLSVVANSDVKEDYNQIDVAVGGVSVMVPLPSFVHNGTTKVNVNSGSLTAGGTLTTAATGKLEMKGNLLDIAVSGLNVEVMKPKFTLDSTQNVNIGDKVKLTGKQVKVQQNLTHKVSAALRHYGLNAADFTFPFLNVAETAHTGISVGNGATLTAKGGGTIDINSADSFTRSLNIEGCTVSVIGVSVRGNTGSVHADNNVKLGDNVTLNAQDGTALGKVNVGAKTADKASLHTDNPYVNALGGDYSSAEISSTLTTALTIGTGFSAVADSVSLKAESNNTLKLVSDKVSVSILLNPYGKIRGITKSDLTSTVTVAGGDIKTTDFEVKALTNSQNYQSAMATGGSILFNNNIAELLSDSCQKADVTLGTGSNKLTILTDNTDIAANNKFRYRSTDDHANVWGGGVGVAVERTSGTVDVKQTANSAVTLGRGVEINRRKDAEHYINRGKYLTSIAATNDVESNVTLDIWAGGVVAPVCLGTTNDVTNATATLSILGAVECWGDTALTAYSHVLQHELNAPNSIPHFIMTGTDIINTVDVTDTLSLSGTVTALGNLALNAGSAAAALKLADGTEVLPGEADSVTRVAYHGADDAVQYNRRKDILTIAGTVKAGGNVTISNNPSVNTSREVFVKTGDNTKDESAAYKGAPEVTSSLNITGSVTAGLGSYLKVNVYERGNDTRVDFTTALDYFGVGTASGNTFVTHQDALKGLYAVNNNVFALSPLSVEGCAVNIVTADKSVTAQSLAGKVRTVSSHGMEIRFDASLPYEVMTTGAAVLSSAEGISLNGKAFAKPTTLALPEIYRSGAVSIVNEAKLGKAPLTLTGKYDMPASTLFVYSRGNLNAVGNFNCGSTEFYTEGDYNMQLQGDYSMNSVAQMFSAVFEKYRAAETAARVDFLGKIGKGAEDFNYPTGTTTRVLSATELKDSQQKLSGTIMAGGRVTIKAGGVLDLNGTITSGALQKDGELLTGDRSVVIPETFMLKDAAGNRISVEEARRRYEEGKSSSRFALADISGVSAYFDVETKNIIVSSDSGVESSIYIEGNIVNTDLTGSASISMAPNLGDLTIDNKSAYTLQLDTLNLAGFGDNRMVLKNTHTGRTDVYYRDTAGNVCHTVQVGSGAAETVAFDGKLHLNTDMKAHLSRYMETTVHEEGRLTFTGSLKGEPQGKTGDNYSDLFGSKSPMVDKIWLDTAAATVRDYQVRYDTQGQVDSFVTTRSRSQMTCTWHHDPGIVYRDVYKVEYKEFRTDTLTLSGNNDIRINIGGAEDGTDLRVTSGDILVNGAVTADRVTMTATTNSISGTDTGLIAAAQLTLNAKANIGSSKRTLQVDSRNVNLTSVPVSSSFTAGESLYVEAKGDLANTTFRAGKTAMLNAEGNVSTDARNGSYADYTSVRSAHGGVSLKDGTSGTFKPGQLSVVAHNAVNISTQNALNLVSVVSEQGDVSITAKGGITPVLKPNTDAFSTLFGETVSTSLYKQSKAMIKEYREIFFKDMERYTALYYKKDADGHYTNRDADGLLRLDTAEADLAGIIEVMTLIYESGQGNILAEELFRYSGTAVVNGTKFANSAEAGVYLAMHPKEVIEAYSKACQQAVMADMTKEIRSRSSEVDEKVDYGMFNESVYRLYWQKDALGHYLWQDADGNFISPTYTDASGKQAAVYTQATCAAITEQFKNSAPAPTYRLKKDNAILTTLGQLAGGYATLTEALARMKEDVGSLAVGKAVEGTAATITARNGEVKLDAGTANIGSDSFVFNIAPASYDKDGNPVYGSWEQSFINEVKNRERLGTRQLGYDTESGTYTFAIDKIYITANTMSALDLELLAQACPDDIHEMNATFEVMPHGYLGVDSKSLTLKGGSVYISSGSDLTICAEGISGKDVRLSSSASISGGTVNASERAVIHADANVGSAENPLCITGSPRLSVTATPEAKQKGGGKVYLKAEADMNLLNLRAEMADVRLGAAASIRKAVAQPDTLSYKSKAPVVEVGRLNVHREASGNMNNLFAADLAIRTTGVGEAKGGLHVYGAAGETVVTDLSVNAANTAYPFYMVLENGATGLKNFTFNFSGYAELSSGIRTVDRSLWVQNNASIGINAVKTASGTQFLNGIGFGGAAPYSISMLGVQTLGDAAPVHVTGDATLSFENLQNPNHDLVLESEGKLNLHHSVLSAPHIALNGHNAISLFADYFKGPLAVTADSGNIRTELIHVAGDAALNAPHGGVEMLGFNLAEGKLVVKAEGDVQGVLTAAPSVEATSLAGNVGMDRVLTDYFSASAGRNLWAYCSNTDKLHTDADKIFSEYGTAPESVGIGAAERSLLSRLGTSLTIGNLTAERGVAALLTDVGSPTRMTGDVSGLHVHLYSSGTFLFEEGCHIDAMFEKPVICENMDMKGRDFAWLKKQTSHSLDLSYFNSLHDTLDEARHSALGSDGKEQESSAAQPGTELRANTAYFDDNGKVLHNAEEYADTYFNNALTGQPQH